MRLSIQHRTAYRFSTPQARLVQMLRLTPQNTHDQTVANWHIDIDCDVRLREGRDGWGNAVTMLYADGPLDGVEIAVTGEVLTSHSDGVVRGVAEPLPPALFLRATEATPVDATIGDWARGVAGGADRLSAMHTLNAAIHERFAIDAGRPEAGLDATEVWARGHGTSRDLAHVLLVAARGIGVPARYVSGYRRVADGEHAAAHGWVEAHVAELGWVGFDSCTGLSPQDEHVRVAVALDAAGAAPIAGSRMGDGEEQLDVALHVSADPSD